MADYKNERKYTGPRHFFTEQFADLTHRALADAGLDKNDLDGICCTAIREANMFAPATLAEYLGLKVNFAEIVVWAGLGQWAWSGGLQLRSRWVSARQ